MTIKVHISEEPVSWIVDDIPVDATLALPVGAGPFPAVIFVAGSGPTDRDWNTPLIPGSNGSGAQLARALAEAGFVTLRYDKRGSGKNAAENARRLFGKISMQGHVNELADGVKLLAGRAEVDPARLFVLTNSEGCVHALNYQTQAPDLPFKAMVLTSAFARATGDVAHSQIAAQLTPLPGGAEILAAYDAAIAEFIAGQPVQVDPALPEGLRNVILAITQPGNQPFARELWGYEPAENLGKVTVPVLVVLGKKDIQVDWQVDGATLEAVAKDRFNISIAYFENANHVLKSELRPKAEITPTDAMMSYSAAEGVLDSTVVDEIVSWLKNQG